MLDWIAYGHIAVDGNGTQVHDGSSGEKHIQIYPNRTKSARQWPGIIWKTERDCFVNTLYETVIHMKNDAEKERKRKKGYIRETEGKVVFQITL